MKALLTGCNGQDGSYLAELPLRDSEGRFAKGNLGFWKGKKIKPLTEQHKKKISNSLKGRQPKNKIGTLKFWLGKKRPNLHSLETRKKISLQRKGENSHLWRGGITAINQKIRTSFEYKEWRKSVFERDNYTCVFCQKRGGVLNADHIKAFSKYPELRLDINNGRTLCKSCHEKTPNYKNRQA